ncbi:MAG: 6,7-dimethyl-8-ribityllumazine synthase [Ginsengibacter sp.]
MAITEINLFNIDTGILQKDAFIVIVRTEWNATIVDKLEEGCIRILQQYNMKNYKIINVPGAFEIPFSVKSFWENSKLEKPQAFIALGCVVRGDTPHFDHICDAVTKGILQLNLSIPAPVIFGVLTVDSYEQAKERVGGEHGHKGEEAAITALKMILLQRSFYSNS